MSKTEIVKYPRLEIKNFGPITEAEIFVNDMMVFIGPQASGKSTIAKTIFLFKSIKSDLQSFVSDKVETNGDWDEDLFRFKHKISEKFFSIYSGDSVQSDFLIQYYYANNKSIMLFFKDKLFDIEISKLLKTELEEIFSNTKIFIQKQSQISRLSLSAVELTRNESTRKAFYENLFKQVNKIFIDDRMPIYIPAGRSLLSSLSGRQKLLLARLNPTGENGNFALKLDYTLKDFFERIEFLKEFFTHSLDVIIAERNVNSQKTVDIKSLKEIIKLSNKILKGHYVNDSNGERIIIQGRKSIQLSFASSGQQEAVWIINQIFALVLNSTKTFLIIEEPEAHLYPEAQKDIVELICLLLNLNGNQILLTTHSPYILSSMNNFIYAGKLGKTQHDEVAKIVNENTWLAPERVSAFFVANGKIRDIIDPELELIKEEEIDSASTLINKQYDQLFELDVHEELHRQI